MRKALLGVALALWLAPPAHAGNTRLVYSSDWSGSGQIYALDPSRGGAPAQLTFGLPVGCEPLVRFCGYGNATPSPDGRWIAYTEASYGCGRRVSLFVAKADGSGRRTLYTGGACSVPYVWSPDSTRLAYVVHETIAVVRLDGSIIRRISGRDPEWSADGRWPS
jgi:Tol biopolymer transport system component